ncbi:hypothetical protein PUR57_01600 [Streptomyces sp. JV176]|uniref:hypothetical protein n=1 Tax=Streptomyces sp. JV176 TaxID=858630 RepID=UPI002E784F1E|nr:hypothetical protein [Streptomyces sp. JV176]MEE1797395.1 hypothetical protein [Streptomyces sp. JV176]
MNQDPDFELYDNVGRTAEQIAAARSGRATRDDLLRWAARDAEQFLAEHPLPNEPLPVPDTAPYLAALAAARTPAEVSAVTQHLLDSAHPALSAVSDLLVAIARWDDRHRAAAPGSPPKALMEAASRSLSVLAIADEADLRVLRAEYDPAPPPPAPRPTPGAASGAIRVSGGLPPAPPSAPPAGPSPGR